MKKRNAVLALTVAFVLLFSACTALLPKQIVGEWTKTETVLGVVTETKYVFNEDGTGTIPAVLGIDLPITYTIEEDVLEIKVTTPEMIEEFAEDLTSKKYTVQIKGKTLTLTNGDKTIELTRKK